MTAVDETKLEQFAGQVVGDLGAAISAVLVYLGDRLGLYKAMAGAGPLEPVELAERTGTAERYVREWLNNQAAGGYVTYDSRTGRYELPPEHAMVLAEEGGPVFMCGGFQAVGAAFSAEPRIGDAFRTGAGVGWDEQDARLFEATERFFRPAYRSQLIPAWIPALEGVEDRLRSGAQVADIGCGHGVSTIEMATAYPQSAFVGFDYHAASIEAARKAAAEAGVGERVTFEVASAKDFPGNGYDLVCFFDCLHDMGDPVGAAAHARQALAPDGAVMLVEPYAGDTVEENLSPVGRAYYGFSTVICTPASLAQEVGLALGAQAGEARLTAVLHEAGLSKVRRAAETPFNLVIEARP